MTSIGDHAFQGCQGLTSINIPNSVTSIGDFAFCNCGGLTSINIPNSVTSIGKSAFEWCVGLTSINIPNSVTSIGDHAFTNCSEIKNVIHVNDILVKCPESYEGKFVIEGNIKTIGKSAFTNCSRLTSIDIPNSVTSIEESAFSWCVGLTSINIPNSVTKIGEYAFLECGKLTSINIPNSVTKIGEGAFANCSNLDTIIFNCNSDFDHVFPYIAPKTLILGDDITIVYNCFSNNGRQLSSITLGKSVSQLRAYVFGNASIKDFHVTGDELPYCYPNVFNKSALSAATLYVYDDLVEYCKSNEPWCLFGTITGVQKEETGVKAIQNDTSDAVDIYTVSGVKVMSKANKDSAVKQLPKGMYIIGGKKVVVK